MIGFGVALIMLALMGLSLMVGAIAGFCYALRGSWADYLDRHVPPRTEGQMAEVLKELVEARQFTEAQAQTLSRALYKQAQKEGRILEWRENQEQARMAAPEVESARREAASLGILPG